MSSNAFWNARRSSVVVPYWNKAPRTWSTPSLATGTWSAGSCRTSPTMLTVELTVSCCTMRRMPLGKVVSYGCNVEGGTESVARASFAQSGSTTGLDGATVVVSLPPNPDCAAAAPDDFGFKLAVTTAPLRYVRATRLTSAGV